MAAYTISDMLDANIPQKHIDFTKKPGRGQLHFLVRRIDFDDFATKNGISLNNADTYQIFDLEAKTVILFAGINIISTATGAASLLLGFVGGNTDNFVKEQIANVAGPARVQTVTEATPPMYASVAEETLDITCATATLAGCKAEVWALIMRP